MYFRPACELLPPWKKELYFTCVLLPLYSTFSLTSFPLPYFPMYSIYRQCVTVGGGWGGVEMYCGQYSAGVYTLFLTRFRTYKIASPPLTKMTSKDDIKGLVSLKFLRPWWGGCGVSANEYGCAHHGTWSPNKLRKNLIRKRRFTYLKTDDQNYYVFHNLFITTMIFGPFGR